MASRSPLALNLAIALAYGPLAAQQRDTTKFHLDLASIMRGEERVGRAPAGDEYDRPIMELFDQWLPHGAGNHNPGK